MAWGRLVSAGLIIGRPTAYAWEFLCANAAVPTRERSEFDLPCTNFAYGLHVRKFFNPRIANDQPASTATETNIAQGFVSCKPKMIIESFALLRRATCVAISMQL